jgi:hypothetical protein
MVKLREPVQLITNVLRAFGRAFGGRDAAQRRVFAESSVEYGAESVLFADGF